MKMLGRCIGSGFCTCLVCGRPDTKSERRRLKRRERQRLNRALSYLMEG